MSVKARLLIDELEVNVLNFSFGFDQGSDSVGRPNQKPIFWGLNLTIETRKDLNLADWAIASNDIKQLELHIYPVILGGKTRKINFIDCHLLNWENNFSSTGNEPLAETLRISSAGLKDSNSAAEYSAYWRTTMPDSDVEETVLEEEEDMTPEVIDFFTSNENGERITNYKIGETIYVEIETKNRIGDTLTIDLTDKTRDFMYEGVRLQNDTLEFEITSNKERIELEVVEEN